MANLCKRGKGEGRLMENPLNSDPMIAGEPAQEMDASLARILSNQITAHEKAKETAVFKLMVLC